MEGISSSPPMAQNKLGSFFSPLLISMVGIVVTSLAIIFYHFFLVKYCMRRHQANAAPAAARRSTGVEKKVLETIPIFSLSALKRDDFPKECVVCLGELEDEEMVRFLPNCKHVFHLSCIDEWFQAHDSCPLCRSPILAQKSDDCDAANSSSSPTDSSTSDSDRESNASGTVDCDDRSLSSSAVQSYGLRRQLSLALPPPVDRRPSRLITGLKRSLSMDQNFVAINLQRESSINNVRENSSPVFSCTGELMRSQSYATRSLNHVDRMSSRLLKSFSRLRLGKRNSSTILPY